jgi:hypothetical protein
MCWTSQMNMWDDSQELDLSGTERTEVCFDVVWLFLVTLLSILQTFRMKQNMFFIVIKKDYALHLTVLSRAVFCPVLSA